MSQWQVLDLGGDPTPGDPDRTRALAGRLLDQAQLVESNSSRLRSVTGSSDALRMAGDYASKFREILSELPGELTKLGTAYRRCGETLSAFATGLAQAKSQAGNALRQGQDAHDTIQGALRQVQAALPAQTTLSQQQVVNPPLLEAAIATLDENLKAQVRPIARRAQFAEQDRQRARRLAQDAARLRGEAENRCADGVRKALDDSGIKNKSWLEKTWDFVSAPFRSWDAFVDLCKTVAMIAGTVALFISGPIGLALVAVALVAGAAVFADTLSKYARGEATLGALALDALGLIPGARGVTSLAALGRSAAGLARGGKAVLGGLRAAPGAIRNGISNLRRNAVENTKRTLCGDPIDVATGDMVFQQTDVDLPAILPLTLRRTQVSSYRVGRWFGPSWACTLDQRLEVDAIGVCYAAEDGMLLVYPHPGEDPVLPEEGPRHPLRRTPDGNYTITEPDSGHTLHFAPVVDTDALMLSLVRISDRNDHRIDLDYDPDGILTQVRHSGGYHVKVDTHDGLITALRLRGGDNGSDITLMRYRYNDARCLTEVINSSDLPLRFDYDPDGRIIRWTDRNDTWYAYTYDEAGRCVRTTGFGGCLSATFAYHHDDPDSAVTEVTNSLGYVTRFELNDACQIIRETNPLGHATASEWDRYDRFLSRTDPLGRATRYTYNEAGNLTAVTRPDGTQALTDYNNLRLPVTITDPDGTVWQQQYDERGNLTAITDPVGTTTHYTYNDCGHLVAVTDPLGHTRQVTTNPAGLPVAVTDPLGAVTRYDRDTFGRTSAITDPVGGVTRLGWTLEGKLAWRTLPDGATEHWTYDGEGNLIEYVDALGQPTRLAYTYFDLPAAQTSPDGAQFEFAYDTELRLTTVINPQGRTWCYDYDPAGNLVGETDYNNRLLTYTHDAAGQFIERTNGAGQTTHYNHNLLGNIIEERSDDAVTTFAYDPAGRLVHSTNPNAELTFERDPLGRVLAETCNGRTLTNTYDPLGRRLTRRTPTDAESVWDYDPHHQPVAVHTAGHTLRFTHDPAGREIERHLDSAVTLTQTWDPNHQLQSQTLTAPGRVPAPSESTRQAHMLQRRSYTYRPDGYLTHIDDHLSGARRFTLDPSGRITTVHGHSWIEHYRYDPAGNIAHATWPASPQAETLDAEARGEREYTGTLIRRAGNVRYQHDQQGRIVLRQHKPPSAKPRTWHYTWDPDDRLIAVTTPDGHRWRYHYDPLGRRIAKQRLTPGENTVIEQVDFTWDGTTLAEQTHTDPNHPDSRIITWAWEPGTFRPLSQTERTSLRSAPQEWVDEQFYAIITDLIGTPTELLDPSGTLIWQAHTSLWGNPLVPTTTSADTPLRFPGQYYDAETGLNYNYLRYYDPSAARYHTTDPLGLLGGTNPHSYVYNPINWLDPLGLKCEKPIRRAYEHNPKHGAKSRTDSRGREVSRAPRGDCQEILDNSVPKGPNSPHRIGVEPETGLPVELRQHLRQEFDDEIVERYHGYVPGG
ncbi:MAG: RHS repeat-associated core domain-containing protein [Pseudonocardiaceae bacterium]